MSDAMVLLAPRTASLAYRAKKRIDAAIMRYDAWFLVFLAVLLALAAAMLAAMAIWCVVYKGKRFTGNWNWSWWGVSVNIECV
jgi:hypothetical protein